MKLNATVLFVQNIERSKVFYTRHLGFSIEHDFGKNVILDSGLALWEVRPGHIINQELNTWNDSNRFELYFEDEDIEAIFSKLEQAGGSFLHKVHEEPWGQRTFRLFDPDSNLIEIGEPLEVFVANLYERGLTETQISKKTGIPLDTVKNLTG